MRKYLTYLHRNLLSIDLHGSVKKIMVTGLFQFSKTTKTERNDQDRNLRWKISWHENDTNNLSLPGTPNFHSIFEVLYSLYMTSQHAITFDHCPNLGMFDITTWLYCNHLYMSRTTFIWRKKIIMEIQFNDSYHRFV